MGPLNQAEASLSTPSGPHNATGSNKRAKTQLPCPGKPDFAPGLLCLAASGRGQLQCSQETPLPVNILTGDPFSHKHSNLPVTSRVRLPVTSRVRQAPAKRPSVKARSLTFLGGAPLPAASLGARDCCMAAMWRPKRSRVA